MPGRGSLVWSEGRAQPAPRLRRVSAGRPTQRPSQPSPVFVGRSVCRLPGQCSPDRRRSCPVGTASVVQSLALRMTFMVRAFRPSLHSLPAKQEGSSYRARTKVLSIHNNIEHQFKTQQPSTVITTEQGQAKQQKEIDGFFFGKLLYICCSGPTQQPRYVRVYYELDAYYNLP